MSIADPPKAVTAEDLIDRPFDGVERDIIRGELREWPKTRRNPNHSGVEVNIAYLLSTWARQRPEPRGKVHSGEAGFRLRRDPETFVGIDVAYVSPEQAASRDRRLKFYDGPPVLAVEIRSPSDSQEKIVEQVTLYLEVGTVVWVVDPDFRTVTIHQPGKSVKALDDDDAIVGDDYLPGFRAGVAELFE